MPCSTDDLDLILQQIDILVASSLSKGSSIMGITCLSKATLSSIIGL